MADMKHMKHISIKQIYKYMQICVHMHICAHSFFDEKTRYPVGTRQKHRGCVSEPPGRKVRNNRRLAATKLRRQRSCERVRDYPQRLKEPIPARAQNGTVQHGKMPTALGGRVLKFPGKGDARDPLEPYWPHRYICIHLQYMKYVSITVYICG
jgi:hypothetical protein